jgi:hypothetical protein
MGKLISGRQGPVIGISTSLELFEKLKHESSRLQNGWHQYDSFNFLVTAWHLFVDWKKSDDPNASSVKKRQSSELPKSMIFVLEVVRDLVNGSKHFELNQRSSDKRKVGEVHTGNEVGFYSYFFHEDIPGVTAETYWYFSIRVLNNLVLRYFEWVFDDSSSAKDFPVELEEAIAYCNISQRKGGASPALWLKGIETAISGKANGQT